MLVLNSLAVIPNKLHLLQLENNMSDKKSEDTSQDPHIMRNDKVGG